MGLTEFTFKLLLIFLPGIITFIIVDNLTVHKETKIHHWIFYSLLFGFISYLPWYFIISLVKTSYSIDLPFYFLNNLLDSKASINIGEIVIASLVSIFNGYLFAFLFNKKIPFRIASFFNVSDKFPEVDAWDLVASKKLPCWVTIRDFKNSIVYLGYLQVTSDCTQRDGLYMEQVKVYESKGGTITQIYTVKSMFLPRKMEDIVIEFN